ncbi:MAG: bifunctional 4-hydroxy-2-oxoglutarate aldolase/2-dehydro-3-deoxy-phosphogluconate aldolase [Anaeromyxobacter sp.]
MTARAPQVLAELVRHGVVPVIRTTEAAVAATAVDWLVEAGFSTFEITLTIPGALGLIEQLAKRPGLLVGAGTVLDAGAARSCVAAGAAYVVSPCLAPEVAEACRAADVACVLGALTPTEVLAASRAGADAVKVFPASSMGGPGHIRALRSVFPGVPLAPTGGIGPDTVGAYLAAGAAFAGVGGELVNEPAIRKGHHAAVTAVARALLEARDRARSAQPPPALDD